MDPLVLEHISKTYAGHKAVDDVSIHVPEGSIFGLLGPNGAGKTTLIRIITHIIAADSGRVYINGELFRRRHRQVIGYMPEERGLYRKMKVGEHLIYLARLKGMSGKESKEKIDFWLEKFLIHDWWNKKIEELSKGMQQKIQFIATVLHEPKLLILDEPFSGLDPVNTKLIKNEIHELQSKGTTVIFSTHRMEQVEEICENIALIHKGQKVLEGDVTSIKHRFKEHRFIIEYKGMFPSACPDFEILDISKSRAVLKVEEGVTNSQLLNYLIQHNVEIVSFSELLPSLNEVFIKQVTEVAHE